MLQHDTSSEQLEDIYASLFLVKCDAILNRANHRQGEKQSKMTKFCSGICLFFVLICVIWAPMLVCDTAIFHNSSYVYLSFPYCLPSFHLYSHFLLFTVAFPFPCPHKE